VNEYGYPIVKSNGKTKPCTHYILELFGRPVYQGLVVRHTCDNPLCINPDHLLIGTHAENVQDRVARNRSAVGENHGRSKLTEKDVRTIGASNLKNIQLSKKYGMDVKTIRNARIGVTWKHIPMEPINPK